MKLRPDPTHTNAWNAVGGVLTLVGTGAIVTFLHESPTAHEPPFLIYGGGILALAGVYLMLAPLIGWWPWGLRMATPYGFALAVVVVTLLGIFHHGAVTHASTQYSPGSRSQKRLAKLRSSTQNSDGERSAAPASSEALYHGKHFTVAIPPGWSMTEDEKDKSGEIESTWVNVADPSDELLIDFSPASDLSLEEDATPVHEALLHESGYRELFYGNGDMHGIPSWMWIFRGPELEHVDYFFVRCSTAFAVLGSSVPGHFAGLRPTFRATAESVRANCR